jgi:serine/threonine protein kinase
MKNRLLDVRMDPGLCKLSNDLTLNSDDKNNNVYGSIPYIPPEVLRGNEFTKEGDIYSFGGIMYEMATGNQPFADQTHDMYLMIDIWFMCYDCISTCSLVSYGANVCSFCYIVNQVYNIRYTYIYLELLTNFLFCVTAEPKI